VWKGEKVKRFSWKRRLTMDTFLMFGKYSPEALKGISGARTKKATALIEKLGGRVKGIYALLGQWELVCIVEMPSIQAAMQDSVDLGKMTGIGFTTAPAVPVEEFDQLMAEK
jgi:uncharacterized protein with GYD domain